MKNNDELFNKLEELYPGKFRNSHNLKIIYTGLPARNKPIHRKWSLYVHNQKLIAESDDDIGIIFTADTAEKLITKIQLLDHEDNERTSSRN